MPDSWRCLHNVLYYEIHVVFTLNFGHTVYSLQRQYGYFDNELVATDVWCVYILFSACQPHACAWCVVPELLVVPTFPVTPEQLIRPGIGWNASCTLGDCITSRPRELCWVLRQFHAICSHNKHKSWLEKFVLKHKLIDIYQSFILLHT